jgi:hypothetical protein
LVDRMFDHDVQEEGDGPGLQNIKSNKQAVHLPFRNLETWVTPVIQCVFLANLLLFSRPSHLTCTMASVCP